MSPRALEFLQTAERNRRFAEDATGREDVPGVTEWGAVAAFYSAVHLINALITERLGLEPASHQEREAMLRMLSELRRDTAAYQRLRDAGYRARYVPMYRVSRTRLEQLVSEDLAAIRVSVHAALNDSSGTMGGS